MGRAPDEDDDVTVASEVDNDVIIATDDDAAVKKEEVTVPLFKDDKVWNILVLNVKKNFWRWDI